MRTLIYILLLCALFTKCYAKPLNRGTHISSIYINTPDSSVKASVTDQPGKNIQVGRIYHWYASNQLCVTNGAYSGRLLHGTYSSFYPNHFLLAQGQFRSGLKDGCWKRWLPDGSLQEIIHYKNGQLHGTHEIYSPKGYLMERIYYRKGARAGKTTIFSQDGKDSVIIYKKGVPKQTGDERRKTEEKKRVKKDDSLNQTGDDRRKTGEKTRAKKDDSLNQTGDDRRDTGEKKRVKKNDSLNQTGDDRRKTGEKKQAKKGSDSLNSKKTEDNARDQPKRKLRLKKGTIRKADSATSDGSFHRHSRLSSLVSRLL